MSELGMQRKRGEFSCHLATIIVGANSDLSTRTSTQNPLRTAWLLWPPVVETHNEVDRHQLAMTMAAAEESQVKGEGSVFLEGAAYSLTPTPGCWQLHFPGFQCVYLEPADLCFLCCLFVPCRLVLVSSFCFHFLSPMSHCFFFYYFLFLNILMQHTLSYCSPFPAPPDLCSLLLLTSYSFS